MKRKIVIEIVSEWDTCFGCNFVSGSSCSAFGRELEKCIVMGGDSDFKRLQECFAAEDEYLEFSKGCFKGWLWRKKQI